MTDDTTLRDQMWAELERTTISGSEWVKRGRPATGHWGAAHTLAAQIDPPPPPTSTGPAAPVGPFTELTKADWFRDVANPTTISRLEVRTTDTVGFGIQGYFNAAGDRPPASPSAFQISDIVGVSTAGFNDNGTSGFGIWLGTKANASRLHGEGPNGGVWVGCQSLGSVLEDVVGICNSGNAGGVGAYYEHLCHNVTTRRASFDCGPNGERSVQVEYTYGGEGSYGLIFDQVEFYCPKGGYGIQLGPGTYGCQILPSCTFTGPGRNILAPKNLADPSKPNVFGPAFSVDWDNDPIG